MLLQNKILMSSHLGLRYTIVEQIGQGSFGKIYLGTDKQTNERVAIKIISKYQHNDEILFELFRKEHAALKQFMGVKNIVKILDFYEDATSFIFVMEYCHCDMLQLIKVVLGVKVLPVNIAIHFIQEITVAMSHIHEAGYLHRDVKPENMLVWFQSDEDFQYLSNQEIPEKDRFNRLYSLIPAKIRIVLTDFGLVRKYTDTIVGTFAGSPKYMSPEILDGEQYEKPADVYALGLCFYEMSVGKHPFEFSRDLIRHSNNIKENWKNIFTGQEGNEVPFPLQQTIKTMLHYNPDLRLQLSDFKHAIEKYEQAQKINPKVRSQLLLHSMMERSQQLQVSSVKLRDQGTTSYLNQQQAQWEEGKVDMNDQRVPLAIQGMVGEYLNPNQHQRMSLAKEFIKSQISIVSSGHQPSSKPYEVRKGAEHGDPQFQQLIQQQQQHQKYQPPPSEASQVAETDPKLLLRQANQAIVYQQPQISQQLSPEQKKFLQEQTASESPQRQVAQPFQQKESLLTGPQQLAHLLPQSTIDVPEALDDAQFHQFMEYQQSPSKLLQTMSLIRSDINVDIFEELKPLANEIKSNIHRIDQLNKLVGLLDQLISQHEFKITPDILISFAEEIRDSINEIHGYIESVLQMLSGTNSVETVVTYNDLLQEVINLRQNQYFKLTQTFTMRNNCSLHLTKVSKLLQTTLKKIKEKKLFSLLNYEYLLEKRRVYINNLEQAITTITNLLQ